MSKDPCCHRPCNSNLLAGLTIGQWQDWAMREAVFGIRLSITLQIDDQSALCFGMRYEGHERIIICMAWALVASKKVTQRHDCVDNIVLIQ